MTVAELVEWLGQYDGELEVRIASQPHWPFENDIEAAWEFDPTEHLETSRDPDNGLWRIIETGRHGEELVEGLADPAACESWIADYAKEHDRVVYLMEGRQLGYLPGTATEGWNS